MNSARHADNADRAELVRLLTEATQSFSVRPGADVFRHPSRLRSPSERVDFALSHADQQAFVGEVDRVPVAIALLRLEQRQQNRVAVLEEVYVEADGRSVGVGESLMDAAESWALEHSCGALEMEALPGDRDIKNLAERHGLRARSITMHKNLL